MVTQLGNAENLPPEWRQQARAIATSAKVLSEEEVTSAIERLLDQCVTEAVLQNMAEMLSPDEVTTINGALDKALAEMGIVRGNAAVLNELGKS